MDLFWTNIDYVGSDNSGLGSVWIHSGPIWIMLDQIILVWDQYGIILNQSDPKPAFLVPPLAINPEPIIRV